MVPGIFRCQAELAAASVGVLHSSLLLEAEEFEESDVSRSPDGRFAPKGGGSTGDSSADTKPSGAKNSSDQASGDKAEKESDSESIEHLADQVNKYRDLLKSIDQADLGSDPHAGDLKSAIRQQIKATILETTKDLMGEPEPAVKPAPSEAAPTEKQSKASKPLLKIDPAKFDEFALPKKVIADPKKFAEDFQDHRDHLSVLAAVDAGRLATAGILAFGEAFMREAKKPENVQKTKDAVTSGVDAAKATAEGIKALATQLQAGYKAKFEQMYKQRSERLATAKAKIQEQAKADKKAEKTSKTAAAEGLQIELPPLKSVDDLDQWADAVPDLLKKLKGVDVIQLATLLNDPGAKKLIQTALNRLLVLD